MTSKYTKGCLAALFFLLSLSACQQARQEVEDDSNPFLPLEEIVSDQVALLSIEGPDLQKVVLLADKQDTLVLTAPDSSVWAKELSWFAEADINDPALHDQFTVTEEQTGDKLVKSYKRKNRAENGVMSIQAHYDAVLDELQFVDIAYVEANAMYDAAREMRLSFGTDDTGELWLRSFTIKGKQSIIFKEAEEYTVEGRVLYTEAVKLH